MDFIVSTDRDWAADIAFGRSALSCIGRFKAGVEMPVTSSGCAVNDGMAAYVVRSLLGAMGSDGRGARPLLMGVTYKENIDDIRNSGSPRWSDCWSVRG